MRLKTSILMKSNKLILALLFLCATHKNLAQCFTQIAASDYFNIALKPDGTLWGQGRALPTFTCYAEPDSPNVLLQIDPATDWAKINTGNHYMLAIKTNGTLWGAGRNSTGFMANGEYGATGVINSNWNLLQIGTATDWKKACGEASISKVAFGLKNNGTLWSWGTNYDNGCLCKNNFLDNYTITQTGTDSDWADVETAGSITLALKTNGTIWACGTNSQLSNPNIPNNNNKTPYFVQLYSMPTNGDWMPELKNDWRFIAGNTQGTVVAINNSNKLFTSGYFATGRGSIGNSRMFEQVNTDTDWKTAACGSQTVYAIKNNNALWAWGKNDFGQLGDGTTIDRLFPVQIGTDTNWEKISPGFQHVIATKTDGSVWAWGNAKNHQIPNNVTPDYSGPDFYSNYYTTPQQIAVAGCTLSSESFSLKTNQLRLAPNPATTETELFYSLEANATDVAVYNMEGKLVAKINILEKGNHCTIDTRRFSAGTYIVILECNNKKMAEQKLIIK